MFNATYVGTMGGAAATIGPNNVTHLIALLVQVSAVHVSNVDVNHIGPGNAGQTAASDEHDNTTSAAVSLVASAALALTTATTKAPRFDDVRPVTLSSQWSRMARLLFISCLSVVGSIGNVFMVSSVMIEDHLKKAGKCSRTVCGTFCNSDIHFSFVFNQMHII